MAKSTLTLSALLGVAAVALLAVGCAPKTNDLGTISQDLAATNRDLATSCTAAVGNFIINGNFETAAGGATGNGSANNISVPSPNPPSTIPSWTGCCGSTNTTTYTVQSTSAHCGTRAVQVASVGAVANVMYQVLDLSKQVGQTFHLSGSVWVTPPTNGGTLQLDLFDLSAKSIVASTVVVNTTTADWFNFSPVQGTVPAAGNVQVRVNTTGNITALVDDLVLTIP